MVVLQRNHLFPMPFKVTLKLAPVRTNMSDPGRSVNNPSNKDNQIFMERNKPIQFEKLISEISSAFINISAQQIDEKITHALKDMVLFFDVGRAVIFQQTKNNEESIVTHLWANSGDFLGVPTDYVISEANWPWTAKQIKEGKVVYWTHLDELPQAASKDKETWVFYGAKSACAIPLMVDGSYFGILSLEALEEEIVWPKAIVERFAVLGRILAAALARKHSDEKLLSSYEQIKILKDRIQSENEYFKDEIKLQHNFEEIIGNSNELKYVLFKIEQIADTDVTVVILGETGTGKELVARAVHEKSRRKNRPLVKIDCGSLPASIIERELFGHEKGTFTGADRKGKGRLEVADGGTLFLDEIGELPLELQPKLLRVIQDGEFERLGDPATRKLDIRIIAASNRDLEAEVNLNKFRKDLWYRLNVFPITIPSLRERRDDIPLLVNWFANKFCRKMGKKIDKIPNSVMRRLTERDWPGNIRELQNTIERAVIISTGGTLNLAETMDDEFKSKKDDNLPGKTLAEVERNHFCRILEETNWRIYGPNGAARILDLNPSTLRFRMKKLDIVKPKN
jgi:formate hydrogenlyase transcriptional activator